MQQDDVGQERCRVYGEGGGDTRGVGLAWSLVLVSVIAVLQSADPRILGRVMSLFAVVLLGGTAAGGPIAASVATMIGPRAPFLVGAAAAVAAVIIITTTNRQADLE